MWPPERLKTLFTPFSKRPSRANCPPDIIPILISFDPMYFSNRKAGASRKTDRSNWNFEIRNPKQIQNPNFQKRKKKAPSLTISFFMRFGLLKF
jgi:hypothetical protein